MEPEEKEATPVPETPPPAEVVAPVVDEAPAPVSLKWPIYLLLVPIVLLTIGSLVMPETIYEGFVKKYYWDPIVGDEGFNRVNTVSWAVLMAGILFLAANIVQRIEQRVTFTLILAVVPYIMAGSVARVLEDTGYFIEPLRYFFVTPIIYVVITAVAVFWIVVGNALQQNSKRAGVDASMMALSAFFLVLWVLYAFWSAYGNDLSEYGNPFVLLLCFAVPLAYLWFNSRATGTVSQAGVMAAFGFAFLLYMVYLVLLWHLGQQWAPVATDKSVPASAGDELRPFVYFAMIVSPAVFVAAVALIARGPASRGNELAAAYLVPVNLLLIFSQMMDATMTSLGIDFYNYSEKHVLPAFLIEWMRTNGPGIFGEYAATTVMLTVKLAVALLVVWAIDIYAKEDMRKYPDVVGLAKLAIIMVGLAPGTRDAVRLAMDV